MSRTTLGKLLVNIGYAVIGAVLGVGLCLVICGVVWLGYFAISGF